VSSVSSGTVTPTRSRSHAAGVRIHWPYVVAEAGFAVYQLGWAVVFLVNGAILGAVGAAYLAACVLAVASISNWTAVRDSMCGAMRSAISARCSGWSR